MEAHKILRVSDFTKDWNSKYGDFTTWFCEVEGIEGVVDVNKKQGNDGPVPGETLEGTFTESDFTDKAGKTHYRFKAASKAFGGAKSYQKSAEEQDSIHRSVALQQAIAAPWATPGNVLGIADEFYAWLKNESKEEKKPARDWTSLHKKKETETIKDTAEQLFPED